MPDSLTTPFIITVLAKHTTWNGSCNQCHELGRNILANIKGILIQNQHLQLYKTKEVDIYKKESC